MKTEKSKKLFERASKVIPGGVNSPVRAFGAVGSEPRFIKSAKGAYIYDEDDNKYIDYIGSWGPMILGHNDERVISAVKKQIEKGMSYGAATKIETETAEFICQNIKHVEKIRMVNSGTEAVMSAVRAARGFSGREKIIKFEGCYHGHADSMLVKAGSGVMTSGIAGSLGVTSGCAKDTLTARYNDIESVKNLFDENKDEIACVIIEPIAANMGVVLPKEGFLKELRDICDKNNAILIFDEVITGFRLAFGGAAQYFGIVPDMVTYGKIIGGGMPVGAYGGRKEIMDMVSPLGGVYQAGTLSGNPIAMCAGLTQLNILRENPDIYDRISEIGEKLRNGFNNVIKKYSLPLSVNGISSLSCLYFSEAEVTDYISAQKSDIDKFAEYFRFMLDRGNYFGASQFEAIFVSNVHTENDIEKTVSDFEEFAKEY